jgi:hypothetical protein
MRTLTRLLLIAALLAPSAHADCFVTPKLTRISVRGQSRTVRIAVDWQPGKGFLPSIHVYDSQGRPLVLSALMDCGTDNPTACGLEDDGGTIAFLRHTAENSDFTEQLSLNASGALAVIANPDDPSETTLEVVRGRLDQGPLTLSRTEQRALCPQLVADTWGEDESDEVAPPPAPIAPEFAARPAWVPSVTGATR